MAAALTPPSNAKRPITEADPDILQYALSQHVVICCPRSLMSVLLLVRNAANTFRVQRRTLDVIACIEAFQSQWHEFAKHLKTADKQLGTFCRTWETLNTTRRNQLQKQLDRINALDVCDELAAVSHGDAPDASTDSVAVRSHNLSQAAWRLCRLRGHPLPADHWEDRLSVR